MQVTKTSISSTQVKLTVSADEAYLKQVKEYALKKLGSKVKLAGFREGKAPLGVVEKNVDQNLLQNEVIDEAVNSLYRTAVTKEAIRPVSNPKISLKKFVPFTELEFEAEVETIGEVKLPDYHKIKKQKPAIKVTADDVKKVLEDLAQRASKRKEVQRAAKSGDQAIIDFKGVDAKGEPINGADGKDYPLILGGNTFIPGFEDNIIGLKPEQKKQFTIRFPKDYGVKALADKNVTFDVTIQKVEQLITPKLDDAFAATVGPFKTLTDLKSDIKKQLEVEKTSQVARQLENEIVLEIVDKSKVHLPAGLVDEQVERLKNEVRQNLAYRGQTWQEMLEAEGKTEEEYIKTNLVPEAEQRVKTGLVLAEITAKEGIDITPDELDIRMKLLKGQYQDAAMQAELDKPEARQEIASRMITEKTINRLVELATK